jgi:putative membrane protein
MKSIILVLATASVAAVLAGAKPALAADPPAAGAKAASHTVSDSDRTFMTNAAGSGLYEVEVSKMAAQKTESADVRNFAEMLVSHHTKANDELKALAASKSVELPKEMPADKKNKMQILEKGTGRAFDRDFIKEVGISDHQKDIRQFEMASRSAKDADLKSWATKTLPTLKQHLGSAQQLAKKK